MASRSIPRAARPKGAKGAAAAAGLARLLFTIAPFLANRARFRAAEPLLALSLSKGPLEPVLGSNYPPATISLPFNAPIESPMSDSIRDTI
jgi:hypothetical protein